MFTVRYVMSLCVYCCCDDRVSLPTTNPEGEHKALISIQPPPMYTKYDVDSTKVIQLRSALLAYQLAQTNDVRSAAKKSVVEHVRTHCFIGTPHPIEPVSELFDAFVTYMNETEFIVEGNNQILYDDVKKFMKAC